jgi:hypothetical protein
MGPATSALPSDPAAARESELPTSPTNPRPRRSDSGIERRIPSARETLATLPSFGADELLDFEPHDTIPAPPWLEDLDEKTSTPTKTP